MVRPASQPWRSAPSSRFCESAVGPHLSFALLRAAESAQRCSVVEAQGRTVGIEGECLVEMLHRRLRALLDRQDTEEPLMEDVTHYPGAYDPNAGSTGIPTFCGRPISVITYAMAMDRGIDLASSTPVGKLVSYDVEEVTCPTCQERLALQVERRLDPCPHGRTTAAECEVCMGKGIWAGS